MVVPQADDAAGVIHRIRPFTALVHPERRGIAPKGKAGERHADLVPERFLDIVQRDLLIRHFGPVHGFLLDRARVDIDL